MKRRRIWIQRSKMASVISEKADLSIGMILESSNFDKNPYCRVIEMGENSFVVKRLNTDNLGKNTYAEYEVYYYTNIDEMGFIIPDKDEVRLAML